MPNFGGASETPAYLEAPDNEDSEGTCEYCGEPVWDEGKYPELCVACNMEAIREEYYEDLAERQQDREWFPEDYED